MLVTSLGAEAPAKLWRGHAVPRAVALPTATRCARGFTDWRPVVARGDSAFGGIGEVRVVFFGPVVPVAIANHHPAVTGGLALGRRRDSFVGKRLAAAAVIAGRNFAHLQRVSWAVFGSCASRWGRAGGQAQAAPLEIATLARGPGDPDAEHADDRGVKGGALGTAGAFAADAAPIDGGAVRAAGLPLGTDETLAAIVGFLQPAADEIRTSPARIGPGRARPLADDALGASTPHPHRARR
jgi:hypothetical protein